MVPSVLDRLEGGQEDTKTPSSVSSPSSHRSTTSRRLFFSDSDIDLSPSEESGRDHKLAFPWSLSLLIFSLAK